MESQAGKLVVVDVGLMGYKEAWDLQTRLHGHLIENKRSGYQQSQNHFLLLCEHPPVFTLGKSGKEDHLKLGEQDLAAHQIEYFKINRGGDITFHGPGQLVGYPILDLDLLFTDVHRYVRNLEEVILRVLKLYGIEGHRNDRYTGVWVKSDEVLYQAKKICAIGVHLSRWVTMHGFAFNINTDLHYFDHIIPCGIDDPDKSITTLARLVGKTVDLQQIKGEVALEFGNVFDLQPVEPDIHTLEQFGFNTLHA